jgi:hypothetical protein
MVWKRSLVTFRVCACGWRLKAKGVFVCISTLLSLLTSMRRQDVGVGVVTYISVILHWCGSGFVGLVHDSTRQPQNKYQSYIYGKAL